MLASVWSNGLFSFISGRTRRPEVLKHICLFPEDNFKSLNHCAIFCTVHDSFIDEPSVHSTTSSIGSTTSAARYPTEFPADILLLIFEYLDLVPQVAHSWDTSLRDYPYRGNVGCWRDIMRVAAVCRHWRFVVLAGLKPVPFLEANTTSLELLSGITDYIQKHSAPSTHGRPLGITLVCPPTASSGVFTEDQAFLSDLADSGVNYADVSSIVMQKMFDFEDSKAVAAYFGRPAPNLRSLVLTGARKLDLPRKMYRAENRAALQRTSEVQRVPQLFGGEAPRLKYLVLRYCVPGPAFDLHRSVTHLRLQWGCGNDPGVFCAMLNAAPGLEVLDLFDAVPAALWTTPHPVPVRLPKLKRLRVAVDFYFHYLETFLWKLIAPSTLHIQVMCADGGRNLRGEGGAASVCDTWRWRMRLLESSG